MNEPLYWIVGGLIWCLLIGWLGYRVFARAQAAKDEHGKASARVEAPGIATDETAQQQAEQEAARAEAAQLAQAARWAAEQAAREQAARLAAEAVARAKASRVAADEEARAQAAREAAAEAARVQAARLAAEQAAREEAARLAAEAAARAEASRLAAEEEARAQAAREAAAEAARVQAARLAAEQAAREEAARLAAEAAARAEASRLAAEEDARAQAAREAAAEAARLQATRLAAEQAAREEAARLASEEAARARAAAAQEAARLKEDQPVALAPARPIVTKTPDQTLVMVADDSKVVRVKTGRLLAQHQYQVSFATDGLDAAHQIETHAPDIVITDVEMPGMDGFELTRHVRQNPLTAHIPVIMITGASEKHREDATRAGVSVLLGKPYPEEELIARIRLAMNSGAAHAGSFAERDLSSAHGGAAAPH